MGIFSFFRRDDESYIDLSSIDNTLKDKLKNEFGFNDEQVEKVVESVKQTLVPLDGGNINSNFDSFKQVVNELELYPDFNVNRIKLCKQINTFVNSNPEISNSVKLIASYIAYGASDVTIDDYKAIVIHNDENIKKKASSILNNFEDRSKIKRLIYTLAQDLVKFEDAFLEKIKNKDGKTIGVKYLPSHTIIIKKDSVTGKPIKYYQILDKKNAEGLSDSQLLINIERSPIGTKIIEFDPDEIIHINNGSPIGLSDSPLLSIAILWRFLKLLEESLIIHRVTRAKRFIIFFLDVTGKTKEAIRRSITSFTNALKNIFTLNVNSGSILSRNSTVRSATDLVIPITRQSKTDIKTIPADVSATKTDDLKFYTNRLLTNFMTSWVFYPEKTGKEDIQKEAMIRMVKIYQKHFSYAITDLYESILKERGLKNVKVKVQFPNPDTQQETKIIDIVVRRMMIINQITAVLGIAPPIKWIAHYVFKDLSETEIDELISLIEQEQRKQQEESKGSELPSIFEKESKINNISIFDKIIQEAEIDEFENVNEKVNNSVKFKVIEQALTYLKNN